MKDQMLLQIRVAVIGYERTGKSTFVNTLLGEECIKLYRKNHEEDSRPKINIFRITPSREKDGKAQEENLVEEQFVARKTKRRKLGEQYASYYRAPYVQHDSEDRVGGREDSGDESDQEDPEISLENVFDIAVKNPLCQMRPDTQLVFIDIPGMKENVLSEDSEEYKDYVRSHWYDFDCVVVVMDAAKSEHHRKLLHFVHENNQSRKHIPTVIVGNKTDEVDGTALKAFVQTTEEALNEIFRQTCTGPLLEQLVGMGNDFDYNPKNTTFPVFLTISSMSAFIFRNISDLTTETFPHYDGGALEKIGIYEVGRKWKGMTIPEKICAIQDLKKLPEEFDQRMDSTNFDKVLSILRYFIGSPEAQQHLLEKQIQTSLKTLSLSRNGEYIADLMYDVFQKGKAIGQTNNDLQNFFWPAYEKREFDAFQMVEQEVSAKFLKCPFDELEQYYRLAEFFRWDTEQDMILKRMKNLVRRLLRLVQTRQKTWSIYAFLNETRSRTEKYDYDSKLVWKKPDRLKWTNLSPNDWIAILFSLKLSLKYLDDFSSAQNERKEVTWIDEKLKYFRSWFSPYIIFQKRYMVSNEPFLQATYKYVNALRMASVNDGKRDAIFKVNIPKDVSDPCHWGYTAWKCSQYSTKGKTQVTGILID